MNDVFFFDSYAFMEILRGNENYRRYQLCGIITTKLNIFEVYYALLRQAETEAANKFITKYYELATDFDEDTIKQACIFKLSRKHANISMTDSIGYIISLKAGVRLLTGDRQFEGLENVEFVK